MADLSCSECSTTLMNNGPSSDYFELSYITEDEDTAYYLCSVKCLQSFVDNIEET